MLALPPIDFSNIPRRWILIGAAILTALVFGIFIFVNLRKIGSGVGRTELTVWGVLPEEEFSTLIAGYASLREKATILYRKFPEDRYHEILLDKLAAGQGPDIFMIKNRWLAQEQNKLTPAPVAQIATPQVQVLFPTVVEEDFIDIYGQVYALPLFIDTLALIYNRDLFDQAAVVHPPRTWSEFRDVVRELRKLNERGQILRAGAAIGGSGASIGTAADILNLLMLQNGAPIVDPVGQVADFSHRGAEENAGLAAFNFYLQFGYAGTPYYTWNDAQGDAVSSFASGKTAMVLGYLRHLEEIQARAPFVAARVVATPQLQEDGAVSYADYWGLAVSRQSYVSEAAWDFIVTTLTSPWIMRTYLEASGEPPALRELIEENLGNPNLDVFVRQALTARSWYDPDERESREIFSRAIQRALRGQVDPVHALNEAAEQLNLLLGELSQRGNASP